MLLFLSILLSSICMPLVHLTYNWLKWFCATWKVLYIIANISTRILISASQPILILIWVGCKETRRSTTRFCTFLVKNCISWSAKKQVTLSRSNTKAEYKAMAITAVELTWLTYVLKDVVVSMKSTPMLYWDNICALRLTVNPIFHARTKHVAIDFHYVRE